MSFHPRRILVITAAVLVMALAGCSLAEDVTPPPNYRQPTAVPEQPVANKTVFPLVPPDPAQGEAIYAEKCLPCHGATGMGDGPQAGNLPNPAAPIGSSQLVRVSRPVDWYNVVTVGNLDKFMPGFSNGLTDRQRWDVVAYTYSLSVSDAELAQGKVLYEANCASCHGTAGMGDGDQAANLPAAPVSWVKDQSRLAALSAEDIAKVMVGGMEGHPSFTEVLDESDRFRVAAYIRTLSFASAERPDPAALVETEEPASGTQSLVEATPDPDATLAPEEVAAVPETITVRGKVSNATPGGPVPQGLQATLLAFSGMSPAFEVSTDVNTDGSYLFEGVEYSADFIYMVQVSANGLTFNSDVLHGRDLAGGEAELPVSIYETTNDAAGLRMARMHLFFDFTNPGKVQVANLYIISNPSDKVVVAEEEGAPVLTYELPQGATNLLFEDGSLGDRYVETANGFGDRMSIGPGEGQTQILFAYDLPYDRKLSINVKPPLPVDAAVVMLPPGIKVSSSQLTDAGQRDVQGMAVQMYQASSSLAAGQALDLTLSGKASDGSMTEQDSLTYLLIGLAGLGLVLVGAGWWLYTARRRELEPVFEGEAGEAGEVPHSPEVAPSSDALLDEILALDDLHASGKLPEAAYQERRAALKAQLAEILRQEKGQ